MKLITGSTAMKYWFGDEFTRQPKDLDYFTDVECKSGDKKIEYLYNPIICSLYLDSEEYIVPEHLLTVKASHLFWDNGFDKHMWDIQFLLKKGYKINISLFYKLYEFWESYLPKKRRSKLDMTANDFFDNAVKFPIYHDDIHDMLIQHPYFNNQPKPIYTKILKDGADVDVSEEKFNLLSYDEKYNLALEEIMVMALERWPNINYRIAYKKMLDKFIMSHAPLWEALFIIENYIQFVKPPFNYQEFLKTKIKEYGLQEA